MMQKKGDVMKYVVIAALLIISSVLIIQKVFFTSQHDSSDKAVIIAQEIRTIASDCHKLSAEEMKVQRLQFLKNNKSATISDLVNAIETKINGKDVITFLNSLNGAVCKEYADSIKKDYEKGKKAIENNYGGTSLETVMYWRLIE